MCGLWAVTVFVVPPIGRGLEAGLLIPFRAAVTVQKAIDADLQGGLEGRSPDAVIAQRREQTLTLYGAQRIEDLPINFQGMVFSNSGAIGVMPCSISTTVT